MRNDASNRMFFAFLDGCRMTDLGYSYPDQIQVLP